MLFRSPYAAAYPPPIRIENALPGRTSFDIEIYGMEGIPASDLAAWKRRTAESNGQQPQDPRPKKAKYSTAPLTAAELKIQLATHKALMSGLPFAGAALPFPPPGFPMPPMGFPGPPPPPGFVPPPFMGMPGPPGSAPFPFPPPPFAGFPPGYVPLSPLDFLV